MRRNFLLRFASAAGVDRDVLMILLLRGWSIIAGGVTMLLIPLFLDHIAQGFYYTFASLLALQIFFELGLNFVISQFASHEYAGAGVEGGKRGSGEVSSRMVALHRMIEKWYTSASLVFAVVVGAGGAYFLGMHSDLARGAWLAPWLTAVAATALNLYWSPVLALLEGCTEIAAVARLRTFQSVLGYLFAWGALGLGLGLWAYVCLPVVSAIWTGIWLRRHTFISKIRLNSSPDIPVLAWRKEIFPMQWRIALSWTSGYLIFQLLVPLAFAYRGPVDAGRLGLCMAVMNSIQALGMSWVNAKAPRFAVYVAEKKGAELQAVFWAVSARSVLFTGVLCLTFVVLAGVLQHQGLRIMQRLPSVEALTYMGLAVVLNSVIFSMAALMRAHKEEPMLWNALVTGTCTAIALWFTAQISLEAMAMAYAATLAFVSLPWCVILWRGYLGRVRRMVATEGRLAG